MSYPVNRPLLERRARVALKDAGIDIPSGKLVTEVVELCIGEASELRNMVGEIMGTVCNRGEPVEGEKLERLAYIAEYCYRDAEGNIQVHFDEESTAD